MRMLVMFDLPTVSSIDRKNYRLFRHFLLSEGFIMHQYSIYSKILLNHSASQGMLKRLEQNKPDNGLVTILTITEKQFSKMIYLSGSYNDCVANSDARIVFLGDNYVED